VSRVGLERIATLEPLLADRLVCMDFLEHRDVVDYVVAIQSFQHGDVSKVEGYFRHAADIMNPNGLLFVRVNSTDTDIMLDHRITEDTDAGFTAVYGAGPKRGLHIRFLTLEGLFRVVEGAGMRMLGEPREVKECRSNHDGRQAGTWSQWEMIAVS